MTITIKFKQLHPDAQIPWYMTSGAAGMDIRAVDRHELFPGDIAVISTGLAVEIPEGYEIQIRPRSGLALNHGVIGVFGTVDSDYRGEIKVALINQNRHTCYYVQPGDRIAQLVVNRVHRASVQLCKDLTPTERGLGGLGSTGR